MMRIKTLLLTLVCLPAVLFSQEKKWTLNECVTHALENNISIKQSELDVKSAQYDKRDAIGNFIPSLNGSGSYSVNTGANINPVTNQFENEVFTSFTTGFNSSLTLFDGLRNIRQLQRAKLAQLATQYQLDKMKDDISLAVANAYLNVLLNKANLSSLQSQNEVSKEQLKRTEDLVEGGVLPKGDLLEIKANMANEKQQIAISRNNVKIALINLAQLMLVKDYENFQIVDEGYELVSNEVANQPVASIIASAEENRPELKIAEQNLAIAQKDVQISRGAYYPTLTAFFGYNTRYSDNDFFERSFTTQLYQNDGIGYGVQLNVPILNGLATRNNVARSKINLERRKYQLEQAKLDLESNVYQAHVDAQGALEAYEAAQEVVKSQELAFDYAQQRYDVGLTNGFDFTQAKQRLDNAIIELNRAKYDYIFKLKVLELYFGIDPQNLKL
ncbi:TolC family protein [uncultured Mesonia sp.]|uniref:TolC family protein n=1 Tax=uncultured Mesonia sp. TaxID=399731 RepID=UPI00374F5C43